MTNERAGKRHNPLIYVVIAVLLIAVGIGGVWVGNRLSRTSAVQEEGRRVDEYEGLGERTGLTGEVTLDAEPLSVTVESGEKFTVDLTLTNKTSRPLLLNDWFTPAPAKFQSNQLPVKMIVRRAGQEVQFFGQPQLLPPHTKKDFVKLNQGESKRFSVTLPMPDGGRWDMAQPGNYSVEIWYETYLSGKYIGVEAWNGMTNHVIVQVTVRPTSVRVQ